MPEDTQLYLKTGLFFIGNWPQGAGSLHNRTIASITDGAATTILLSENVRAGFDPVTRTNWASPMPPRNSFFLSSYVCEGFRCSEGRVDYRRANDRSNAPQSSEAINAAIGQAEGEAPWPSSLHHNGVNVVMCDGHARFLPETVDGGVYAALVSPQGATIRGPLGQVLVDDGGY